MKIMGLRPWVGYLSWFTTATGSFLIIAISCGWLMARTFVSRTAPSLLFLYLFLFFMTEIAFVFLLSTFFSKAKLAAIGKRGSSGDRIGTIRVTNRISVVLPSRPCERLRDGAATLHLLWNQ
jgi:hypothetical protein